MLIKLNLASVLSSVKGGGLGPDPTVCKETKRQTKKAQERLVKKAIKKKKEERGKE